MNVVYDDANLTVSIEGVEEVIDRLGEFRSKSPATVKAALNATAREVRKMQIKAAKARYAVNAAGAKHLEDLSTKNGKGHSATVSNLEAVLYDAKLKSDLGYFEHRPTQTFQSWHVFTDAPENVFAHVLKSEPMTALHGTGDKSKAFLVEFRNKSGNNHIGMVQRKIGVDAEQGKGASRLSERRWRNKDGIIEQLSTLGAPSATAMHGKVWSEVEPAAEDILLENIEAQLERTLARVAAKVR